MPAPGGGPRHRIFIVGTQKSGTTWLRNGFAAVAPTFEGEPYYPALKRSIEKHLEAYMSGSPAAYAATAVAVAAYEALMGDRRVDKSAYPCSGESGAVDVGLHGSAIDLVRSDFPGARTVMIIRDPRSVYVSLRHYVDHFERGRSARIDVTAFARTWVALNERWAASRPDAMVSYEGLKADFAGSFGRTAAAAGIDLDRRRIEEVAARTYGMETFRRRQPEIYRKGEVDEWRRPEHRDASEKIERICAATMARLCHAGIV